MELNPNDMEEYKAKDLSKNLGIAAPKISELEHGRAVSLSELQAYHKYFNVPYEYLLGESNSRYYENMALSEELGLTGESIEHLKRTNKLFNSYTYNSSDRRTPEGTELRAINFLLETSRSTLFEIGMYLDSAMDDADCVQLQYVKFNYSDNGDDDSRADVKTLPIYYQYSLYYLFTYTAFTGLQKKGGQYMAYTTISTKHVICPL